MGYYRNFRPRAPRLGDDGALDVYTMPGLSMQATGAGIVPADSSPPFASLAPTQSDFLNETPTPDLPGGIPSDNQPNPTIPESFPIAIPGGGNSTPPGAPSTPGSSSSAIDWVSAIGKTVTSGLTLLERYGVLQPVRPSWSTPVAATTPRATAYPTMPRPSTASIFGGDSMLPLLALAGLGYALMSGKFGGSRRRRRARR